MKKSQWGIILVVLGVSGLAWWGYRAMGWGGDGAELVDVLAAKVSLPVGTILEAGHLETVKIPKAYIQPGAVRRLTDAVGQVTVAQIASREQLMANKISESPPSVSSAIPFGRRAFTLPSEASSGLSGLIKPGDMVDVLATIEGVEGQREVTQTSTLVQLVRVIAIGSRFKPAPTVKRSPGSDEMARAMAQEVVTVAVTPHESELLAFAEQRGRLKVVVRSVGDADIGSTKPVNFGALLKGSVTPAKPSESTVPQIIQGLEPPER